MEEVDPAALASGWRVWHEDMSGEVILVFRPDVFTEAEGFPAACLPTILVSNRSRARRPGARRRRGGTWSVVLTLEPDVEVAVTEHASQEAAVAGAMALAAAFTDGEVDLRSAYQVPRTAYLDRLDALTGTDS
ncbi:MAG: DUF5820 family protein [Haloquadratum sp.]|jgi:hypothetical protein|nr:DUF5820 family protein [Haloferacaceae archaeon]MDR9445773.1 DUF5820 family protein [Haloquadratum sp.]